VSEVSALTTPFGHFNNIVHINELELIRRIDIRSMIRQDRR